MKTRILLTGGSGMVGMNFIERAKTEKFDILSPTSQELNLLNYEATKKYLTQHNPDIIIHAAGRVGGIQANIREPVRFLLDNLDMGRNIVWASRSVGVKNLINLGSSCMYPHNAQNPLKEEMVLTGKLEPTNEGYALSKCITARLAEYISYEDKLFQYKTLIPCNIYGRFDKFDPKHSHMLPAIITKLHDAKEKNIDSIDIWGDGTARREFMYAEDLADCLVKSVYNFDTLPPLMNIGIGSDHTINEYYQSIADVIGYKGKFSHDLSKPVGMQQKLVSVEKSTIWGWSYKTSLDEGIAKTYEYFLTTKER
jgi:GDP-L-fucose synthase